MKKIFILLVLALGALTACNKSEKNNSGSTSDDPVEKSKECSLIALKAKVGSSQTIGTLYEEDGNLTYVLTYDANEKDLFTKATLIAKVSPNATTNLVEGKEYDLIKGLEIVVTAEDGITSKTYQVESSEGEFIIDCSEVWYKTATQANFTSVNNSNTTGPVVAFSGPDHIVYVDGTVVSIEDASKVGTLNMDGTDYDKLYNITNDENGVLIGSASPEAPSDNPKDFYLYAWLDGWDKAPTKIYEQLNDQPVGGGAYRYLSCGGDINGDFIFSYISGAGEAPVLHNVFTVKNGDFANCSWTDMYVNYKRADGNYGQMVSPASGSLNGWWFIGDSHGNNEGYHVYARNGVDGNDIELYGTVVDDGYGYADLEVNNQYGNYSAGNVRAFTFHGVAYVVASTTGWPDTYVTVQTSNPDEENHYLMRTQQYKADQCAPSAAYVYDAENDLGHIAVVSAGHDQHVPVFVALFDVTRKMF